MAFPLPLPLSLVSLLRLVWFAWFVWFVWFVWSSGCFELCSLFVCSIKLNYLLHKPCPLSGLPFPTLPFPSPFGHYKSQRATRCKVLSHEKVCYTAHGHAHLFFWTGRQQLQLQLSLGRTHYYTLSGAEIRQNFPFGRRRHRCRCFVSCFPFFFGFSLFFICHNSGLERAAVFPRVALFLVVVVDIAFITFRFIHLFHCSLLPSFISDSAI